MRISDWSSDVCSSDLLNSREKLLAYAAQHNIPITKKKDGGSPYSMDANALHISYEGGGLEDPWWSPDDGIWRWTKNPEDAPADAQVITIEFDKGDAVAIDGVRGTPFQILEKQIGRAQCRERGMQ